MSHNHGIMKDHEAETCNNFAPLQNKQLFVSCFGFAITCYQLPLFALNQNTYFLAGMSAAQYGFLSRDWQATRTDNIPLFSRLVSLLHSLGVDWIWYLIMICLAAAYAAALISVVRQCDARASKPVAHYGILAGLILLHGGWLFSSWLPPTAILNGFERARRVFVEGVAGQYTLGYFVEPSTFGVLILAGISLFVARREYLAILCISAAALFHPTYILHAFVLTTAMAWRLCNEKEHLSALVVGAILALTQLPNVYYLYTTFAPSNAVVFADAQSILIRERIPHHANVLEWMSVSSGVKCIIMGSGWYLSKSNKRLFVMLTGGLASAVGLTILQVVTSNASLALAFPWRMSVWLVPLCSAVLATYLLKAVCRLLDGSLKGKFRQSLWENRWLRVALAASLGLLIVLSVQANSRTDAKKRMPVTEFVKEFRQPDQNYVVPLEFEAFRLTTGVPVYVDWKSHPYKDVEVIEWFERVSRVRRFMEAKSGQEALRALERIRDEAEVSHVLLPMGKAAILADVAGRVIYRDHDYIVVKLE